eukprot:m.357719 g.357719  ORF g.357719 m.357719 type:complete len:172 (-) comp16616_c1_seq13:614-1129(-)
MSAYAQLNLIKHRLAVLHIRDAEADQMIKRGHRLKAEVAVEIEAAESELASAVAAPLECDEDPTGWLPNELMILILLHQLYGLDGCRHLVSGSSNEADGESIAVACGRRRNCVPKNTDRARWLCVGVGGGHAWESVHWGGHHCESVVWMDWRLPPNVEWPYRRGECACDRA